MPAFEAELATIAAAVEAKLTQLLAPASQPGETARPERGETKARSSVLPVTAQRDRSSP